MSFWDGWMTGAVASIALTLGSLMTKKIDLAGALTGGTITFLMFLGSGWLGVAVLTAFFLAGTLVSQYKKKRKKEMALEQENEGKRTIVNAVANGGVAAICGFLAVVFPHLQVFFEVGMVASIASANSDTFSSELGNVLGKRYFNILTFKPDKRGMDGAISWEGTLAGLMGSAFIGSLYYAFRADVGFFALIIFVGFIGNLSDSILGATIQRQSVVDNHQVNFLSTLIAGTLGLLLAFVIGM